MTRLVNGSGSLLPTLVHLRVVEAASGAPGEIVPRCLFPARPDVTKPEKGPRWQKQTARHTVIEDAILGRETHPDVWETAQLDPFGDFAANVLGWLRARAPLASSSILNGVTPGSVRVEVPYAYDLEADAARELPSKGHRDYSDAKDWELPGTLDVEWSGLSGSRVFVVDWKTGTSRADVAEENAQLAFLVLCAARARGASDGVGWIAQVDNDGTVRATERYFSTAALDAFACWLMELPALVAAAQPTPGDHCSSKFCDLMGICPATVEQATTLAKDESLRAIVLPKDTTPAPATGGALHPWTPIVQSVGHARQLLHALPFVKAWAKQAEESLEAWSSKEPIPRDDGKVWGPERGSAENLTYNDAARTVLVDRLGDQAVYATTTSASKKGITTAARLHIDATRTLEPKEAAAEAGKLAEETFQALRTVGALTQEERISFDWHDPVPGDAAAAPEKKKRGRPKKGTT